MTFGSEAWVLKKREEQRLEAAPIKFLRDLLGIPNWIKKRINVLGEKTGAQNIVKEIKQYQKKWLQHVQRMGTNRIPKQALRYRIYLLTVIWLTPGGSSTVHIYTQTIHRTTQNKQYIEQHNNLGECGPCPVLASYTLAFALQLRKKHGKTSVRVAASKNT